MLIRELKLNIDGEEKYIKRSGSGTIFITDRYNRTGEMSGGFTIVCNNVSSYEDSSFQDGSYNITVEDAYIRVDKDTLVRLNLDPKFENLLLGMDLASKFFEMSMEKCKLNSVSISGEITKGTLIITHIKGGSPIRDVTIELSNRWMKLQDAVKCMLTEDNPKSILEELNELDIEILDKVRRCIKNQMLHLMNNVTRKLNSITWIPYGEDWEYVNFTIPDQYNREGKFLNIKANDLVKYFTIIDLEEYFDINKSDTGEYILNIKELYSSDRLLTIKKIQISRSAVKKEVMLSIADRESHQLKITV